MATINQLTHKTAEALAIEIPATVKRNTLRVEKKGDEYIRAITQNKGYYDKIADAFDKVASVCTSAYDGPDIGSDSIRAALKKSARHAHRRAEVSRLRKKECLQRYDITRDIYTSINN